MVNENCRQVEENLANLKAKPELITKLDQQQKISTSTSPSIKSVSELHIDESTPIAAIKSSNELNTQQIEPSSSKSSPVKIQSILACKKRIIHRYFDELSHKYVQSHNTDLKDFNLKDRTKGSQSIVLDQIRDTVSKITTYSEFKCIASVNYNNDLYSMSSIVSSVDFDKSYEHFAMAGVTKRIKIFDFANILDRPYGVHYPLYEMVHNAKLSCVSWNRYFRQQLACSDYEGVVTLWDAEAGNLVRSYQEHEKRCWGVQFCDVDPRLLASASDDSKVKIWSTNSEYSLLSIDAKSNVCCVVFKPDSKFHVLFGTADHSIHYYDLRNPKEAVSLFKGHKKAVSYVKFSGENEFVSASTDSNLKMWKLNEGQCIRSFTGHTNEKNFVGLEAHNGYIVTGSENNTVYLYCNELSKPLITYKFDDGGVNKKDEGMNDFVSAVCWSNVSFCAFIFK
jgi:E3 ubiquitin-protein ligase RFWD2